MNYLLALKTNHLHTPQAVFCTEKCSTMSWGIPAVEGNWSKSHQLGCSGISTLQCVDCAHTITSLLVLWIWHIVDGDMQGFHLVGHTWHGIHYSDKSSYCHGMMTPTEGEKIGMKKLCSLPWAWCYDPQLDACQTWVAESVPTCQILSWCRGGKICPSHLWGKTEDLNDIFGFTTKISVLIGCFLIK